MKLNRGRLGLVAASALFIGAAACSNKPQTADASLTADLKAAGGSAGDVELAPRGNPSQVVVSPLEGGPRSAPKKAAPQRIYKPTPRAATQVASQNQPAPQPTPAPPVITQPAPQPAPTPVEPAPAPVSRPAPVQAQERQHGPYKTEAQIFQQMPWIRP
jgi:outer membrane biosynthesis protein TonB